MKKGLVIIASAATGFLVYSLLKKRFEKLNNAQHPTTEKHKSHHLTKVFAKAKKKAVS